VHLCHGVRHAVPEVQLSGMSPPLSELIEGLSGNTEVPFIEVQDLNSTICEEAIKNSGTFIAAAIAKNHVGFQDRWAADDRVVASNKLRQIEKARLLQGNRDNDGAIERDHLGRPLSS
jgi:hypothetical protein